MARVRHGQDDYAAYHITTRTLDQAFYLASDEDKRGIVSALDFYRRRGDFALYAFVIMNNHVHLIIQPSEGKELSAIVRDFKKWTSRRNRNKPPGVPLWERRYDDNQIRGSDEMLSVVRYIHENPVRANMIVTPEDYLWSSARNYAGMTPTAMEVTREW